MSKVRNCKLSAVFYLAVLTVFVNLFIGMPVGYSLGAEVSMDLQVVYDKTTDSVTLRWFPAFPDRIETFEIICYSQSGEIKKTQTMAAQNRTFLIEQAAQSGLYETQVRAFDSTGTEIEVTPRERVFSGISKAATVSILAAGQLDVSLVSCDSRNFPFIYLTVRVNEDGQPVGDLTVANFEVTEDGRLQTDFFGVTPPGTGGGVRMADIVFLIDTSGSMGGEIAAVRNNCVSFANSLATSDINYRLGLVRFGNLSGANPGIIGGGLTENAETFKSWVATLGASGGYEPGFAAIRLAIQSYNFRPGAQKVFILITDEDSDDRNLASTVNLILANDVTVHTAVNSSSGTTYADYIGPSSVRGVSGGLTFSVTSPLNSVLDTIAGYAANTYIVQYRTDNPVMNGVERQGVCTVDNGVSNDSVPFSYIPGGAPIIVRTAATIALHDDSLVAGSSPTIAAIVTDSAEPFVQNATLYVRTTGSATVYTPVTMTYQGGDFYSAQVPAGSIVHPGLDYYIRATDGQVTSSDPSVDPDVNPYQIAVLPNIAPSIEHTSPEYGVPGQDLDLVIAMTDDTYYLEKVTVYHRLQGNLLWNSESVSFTSPGPTTTTETITIDGGHVTAPAVEYYIEVTDNLGLSRLWPEGGADQPHIVPVSVIELEALWLWPGDPVIHTGVFYTITVQLTNPSSSEVTAGVSLSESGIYPDRSWDVAGSDYATWKTTIFEGTVPKEEEVYSMGSTILVNVPPDTTIHTYFTGAHKWQWLKPWDFFHVLTSLAVLVIDTPGWASLTPLTLAITMSPAFEAVPTVTYQYTGQVLVGPLVVEEASHDVAILINPLNQFAFGTSIGLAATNFLPSSAGITLLLSGVGAPVALPFFIWEAAQFVVAEATYVVASDPPDSNYQELAQAILVELLEIEELSDPFAKRACYLAIGCMAHAQAYRNSVERYQGAVEANDLTWMSLHSQVAAYHAEHLAELYQEAINAYEDLIPSFEIPDLAMMEAIRNYFAENGLPLVERKILLSQGFTEDDINDISLGLSNIPDSQLQSLPELYSISRITAKWLMNLPATGPDAPASTLLADVDIDPDVLNLKSKGTWITCYIELPEGYDVSQIDIGTLKLQNIVIAESKPTEVGDYDNDGIPDLMVKFDRQELIQLLDPGEQIIALTGQLTDGTPIAGIDVIRVIH